MVSSNMSDVELYESEFETGSDDGRWTSTASTAASTRPDTEMKDQFSRKETKAVFRVRMIILFVLVLAAAGVSTAVFLTTRNAELDEFSVQYEGSAEKILDSFNGIFQEMTSISGLAVSHTASSVDLGQTYPYVTLSNFQEKAGNARALSRTLFVSISNVVTKEQLAEYDQFVLSDNNTWM